VTLREAVLLPPALAAGTAAFVALALDRAEGADAPFAATLLLLAGAAACGPFSFEAPPGSPRWAPARRGALAALSFAACGGAACAAFGGNPAAGLLAGPFAFALGAAAHALGGGLARAAAAALGLALLATLFHWDPLLLRAGDRKASAALAFAINPAAAASVTLGFDWIHSPELYRNNQTAESLAMVPLPGAGAMALRLLAAGAVAALAGLWRRP
jgi:hypothetical protein